MRLIDHKVTCGVEHRQAREGARDVEAKQQARITFGEYAQDYLSWSATATVPTLHPLELTFWTRATASR